MAGQREELLGMIKSLTKLKVEYENKVDSTQDYAEQLNHIIEGLEKVECLLEEIQINIDDLD